MKLHPGLKNRPVFDVRLAKEDPVRRALHESEDWYQDLIDHSQDLLCVHDLEGRLLSINPPPARLLGYSTEEMLRIPMREHVAPEFRADFDAYLKRIELEGAAHGFLIVMTRSGQRRVWEYSNTLRRNGGAKAIVSGMARDITEQRHTEDLLQGATEGLLHRVRESERVIRELKLFRTLVDQSNDALEVIDPETLRFLDVNEKACSDLGYSRAELLSFGVFDVDPGATESSAARVKEKLRESGSLVMESLHRRKDGSTFPVELSLSRVLLDREYILVGARDTSERKRAEARLQEGENRYRTLYDRAPVGIAWIDQSGRFLGVNPKFCEIAGRTEKDLLSRDFQSITHPDDLPLNLEQLCKLRADEVRKFEIEKRYVRPDGSVRWVEVEAVAMGSEGGNSDWHMAIVQDITERRQADERLREYERVVESLEEMIVVVDRDYRYVIANRAYLHYRGVQKEQVIGRRVDEIVNRESVALVVKRLDECFQGKVVQYEMKYQYPNVGERDLLVSYFPIEGPTGIDRIAAVLRDTTEHKQSEKDLRQTKEFSENLIRTANVIILGLDTRGNVNLFNQAAEKITGYTSSELKGKHWSILVPKDRFPHVWEEFDRLIAGTAGESFESPILTKTGEERYIAWRNSTVKVNGSVVATISFGEDVTERKRAQEALQGSEENYRLFVSQSSEGIFREEMDAPISIELPEDELVQHILYDSYLGECNDAMARMYGLESGKDLVGKRLSEMVVPDDPNNIELTREYIRSGFRVLERESHEVDIHGNPKVFLNSMIGTVENGMLVRTWGIQRDITDKVRLEEARRKAEENLRRNVAQLQQVTEELRLAKETLVGEKLYLEEAIDTELGFGEIIGRSGGMKEVLDKVARVAPSDATVLLLGETGTGKELVARALHRLSKRHSNSFIKLNCAAIPSGLLESELFGHEKGAFTGAVSRKLGRLELADKGTLFLDEIGEIPLSLQPKLLRVLQDQEFERLGGTQTLKVNFRLLAATNRDLLQAVKAREFRSDLYYRLNVFPILIPPLRERREDVPPLIQHFVRKFAAQMKKSIVRIPSKTMEMLVRWEWPGNIRELENFVERSVILTHGSVLQAPLSELETDGSRNGGGGENLRELERERILRALRDCGGKLGGADGAAARLGLKRTTLQSKLDHLGIKPGAFRA